MKGKEHQILGQVDMIQVQGLIEIVVLVLHPGMISDQHINSPYNFNTLSSRQVMRIKKIIN